MGINAMQLVCSDHAEGKIEAASVLGTRDQMRFSQGSETLRSFESWYFLLCWAQRSQIILDNLPISR
jgi:hypothetical protein